MFVDGRAQSTVPDTDYDLVVVGGGPAGISLVHALKDSGLKIALLESGGLEYDDGPQSLAAGEMSGHDDYDIEFSRQRFLGGASNHWGGHCLPLDPIDFTRSWNGFSSWPFDRAALDPFYARAHEYCDLGAYRYDPETLIPDDPALDLFPDTPEIETAIVRQSTPTTRFGEKYEAELAASETIHVWLWTTAVGVSTKPGEREWVRTRTLDGLERQFTARSVVLSGGTLQSTRLLMWSNLENETRAGEAGGLLGRCYMDHPSGGAAFLHFTRPQGEKIYWSDSDEMADEHVPLLFPLRLTDAHIDALGLPNAHFYVLPFADDDRVQKRARTADRGYRSMVSVAKWALGRDVNARFDLGREYCNAVTSADELVVARATKMFGGGTYNRALLRYEIEQRPDLENTVRLDVSSRDATGVPFPVLNWVPAQADIDAIRAHVTEIGRLAGALNLGRIQFEDHSDEPFWGASTAWHQLGTMRMAESRTAGVTDPNCKVHDAGALYVASGAVFPTSGRANPTLTIVALSLRLADHLKQELAE